MTENSSALSLTAQAEAERVAEPSGKRSRRRLHVALVVIALCAITLRTLGAWYYQYDHNPDFGIVALMAKHMAEGRDFPVFFYGQPYMGSLEPGISAFFCYVLGFSGLAVCLGTVLMGLVLLPVVYMWGKDSAGKAGGLAAMAFCAMGPSGFYHYMLSPRGGYPVAIVAGTAAIWLSARIICRERRRDPVSVLWYCGLGLIAGLGWWSNQLVAAALVTAGLMFILLLRQKVFNCRIIFGPIGFIMGSAPFWVWNILNDWKSFSFLHSFGRTDFQTGLKLFFLDRFFHLTDLIHAPSLWRMAMIGVYVGAVVLALFVLCSSIRKKTLSDRHVYIIACLLFILVSALVFSRSHFAQLKTPRYLLPIVPAMGVILAVATGWLLERLPFGLGWIPTLLVVSWQLAALPQHAERSGNSKQFYVRVQNFGDLLDTKRIGGIYTPYQHHSLNYMLGERTTFADLKRERYRPYARTLELTDDVGVLNNYGKLEDFLAVNGGTSLKTGVRGLNVDYGFVAPTAGRSELIQQHWHSVTDQSGHDVRATLSDNRIDTAWTSGASPAIPSSLEIQLTEPHDVSSVRLLCRDLSTPRRWSMDVQPTPGGEWLEVFRERATTFYYWSGPRPFWRGRHFRMEARFATKTVSGIRIRMGNDEGDTLSYFSELQIFGPAPEREAESDSLDALSAVIEQRQIESVYTDTWLANALYQRTNGRVATCVDPKRVAETSEKTLSPVISLSPDTAMVALAENAALCRRVFALRRIVARETVVGPWVLFDFPAGVWKEFYGEPQGLEWRGYACLAADRREWLYALTQRSQQQLDRGESSEALDTVQLALDACRTFIPAVKLSAEVLRSRGLDLDAGKVEAIATPATVANTAFRNGITLLGVSVRPLRVKRGGRIHVSYYWTTPPKIETDELAVFVHFKHGKSVFQDDHVLLAGTDTSFQPLGAEVFLEERTVGVPRSASPGDYEIRLGLHDRQPPAKRLKARTRLPFRKGALTIPIVIAVSD